MCEKQATSLSLIAAGVCVGSCLVGLAEVVIVNSRPPVVGLQEAVIVSAAAAAAVLFWSVLAGASIAALVLRFTPVRRWVTNARVAPGWAVALVLMSGGVLTHVVNATQYLRLYLAIHVALTIFGSIVAVAGATVLAIRWSKSGWFAKASSWGVVAVAAALVLPVALVVASPQRKANALEKTTPLAQILLLVRAVSPEPSDAVVNGTPPVRSLTPQPMQSVSGVAAKANVLLITFDAMRGDQLSPGRPDLELTNTEAMAREGTTFTTTYSPSCWTVPAMAGTLTSRYPSELVFDRVVVDRSLQFFLVSREDGLLENPFAKRAIPAPIRDRTPSLVGFLRQAGYQTLTVPSWEIYHPRAGITRDFEFYDDKPLRKNLEAGLSGKQDVELTAAALSLLQAAEPSRPIFLWLHYMEPHAPYRAHGDVRPEASDQERYASELQYVDTEAGKILDAFRTRGLLDNTIVIVHGDHGEEFGEHGGKFHASSVYEEQLRVAFVVRLPPRLHVPRGQKLDIPVSLLDLTPTLLDLLGIKRPEPLAGRSLVPSLQGHSLPPRPVVAECVRWGRQKRAVVDWPFKLIVDDTLATIQLYNLESDPKEQRPVVNDAVAKSLFDLLPPLGSSRR